MKKTNILLVTTLLAMASFISCSKDDKDEKSGLNETISAKWEINDPKSTYSSFEFSKDGNYIVIKNMNLSSNRSGFVISPEKLLGMETNENESATRASDSNLSPIHLGTYKIEGDKIILSGFGTLEVISITAEEFSFYFTLEATGEKGQYQANKSVAVASSSRTDMLCRTWIFDKITIDETLVSAKDKKELIEEYGQNWKANFEKEMNQELKQSQVTVLFSKAGTYLVLYNGELGGESGLSEWKWANSEETAFYYSWDNWRYTGGPVPIKELTNKRLVVQEEFIIEEFIAK